MKHIMHISLLDDTVRDISPEGVMSVRLTNGHGFALRDGESFEDALKRIDGWFDVAVEIDVDPFNQASVTKILIHPDSDLKDTANNRKSIAEQFLQGWATAKKTPRPAAQTIRDQVVIDFFMTLPESVERVKELLNQGLNVVAVLGAKGAMVKAYQKTNDTKGLVMTLQEEMVKQGYPLDIGPDGKSCFAYLIWHSTDSIDAPFEAGTLALLDPTDLKMMNLVKSHGLGTRHKKFKLEDV